MTEDEIKRDMAIYEVACLAYARNRRTDDPLGCDRAAMAAAFLTIRHGLTTEPAQVAIH